MRLTIISHAQLAFDVKCHWQEKVCEIGGKRILLEIESIWLTSETWVKIKIDEASVIMTCDSIVLPGWFNKIRISNSVEWENLKFNYPLKLKENRGKLFLRCTVAELASATLSNYSGKVRSWSWDWKIARSSLNLKSRETSNSQRVFTSSISLAVFFLYFELETSTTPYWVLVIHDMKRPFAKFGNFVWTSPLKFNYWGFLSHFQTFFC